MTKSHLVRVAIALAGLALTTTGAQAADAKDVHPNFAGRWELVPDRSDAAGEATEALLAPQPRDSGPMGGRRGPGGGWGGGGRRGPGGGGPGGWGGGGGGGRGWGRPPDGETAPSDEERAALRDAVQLAIDAAPSIEIAQDKLQIEMRYPQDPQERRRSLFTDGKKSSRARWNRKAEWKKGRLAIETRTPQLKIVETLALAPENGELRIEVRATREGFSGQLVYRRVYRRVAETS